MIKFYKTISIFCQDCQKHLYKISLRSDKYFRSYREKQNGTPRELTPYDLLDAHNNIYALPKTASNTCTKFHYDPLSISQVIAKNRYATPGSYTPKLINFYKTRCVWLDRPGPSALYKISLRSDKYFRSYSKNLV